MLIVKRFLDKDWWWVGQMEVNPFMVFLYEGNRACDAGYDLSLLKAVCNKYVF